MPCLLNSGFRLPRAQRETSSCDFSSLRLQRRLQQLGSWLVGPQEGLVLPSCQSWLPARQREMARLRCRSEQLPQRLVSNEKGLVLREAGQGMRGCFTTDFPGWTRIYLASCAGEWLLDLGAHCCRRCRNRLFHSCRTACGGCCCRLRVAVDAGWWSLGLASGESRSSSRQSPIRLQCWPGECCGRLVVSQEDLVLRSSAQGLRSLRRRLAKSSLELPKKGPASLAPKTGLERGLEQTSLRSKRL